MTKYTITELREGRVGVSATFKSDTLQKETLSFKLSLWVEEGLKKGLEVDERRMDHLRYLAQVSAAAAKAETLIAYSDYSRGRLVRRLGEFDFEREVCEDAADIIIAEGFIDEEMQAERIARQSLKGKCWGKRRIAADLQAKGYSKDAILYALSFITREDEREVLLRLIHQKYKAPAEDRREFDRRVAALTRLGHSAGEIIKELKKEP